jgi:hypothetical protein
MQHGPCFAPRRFFPREETSLSSLLVEFVSQIGARATYQHQHYDSRL